MLFWDDISGILGSYLWPKLFIYFVHLSDKRVREIQDIPISTLVSAIRSFVGMVNYFHDFIPSLSSYLGPLTDLTKKRNFGEYNGFEMTEKVISAFRIVKDQVAHHTSRVLMNAYDSLILYTHASTRVIDGVLMQVQGGKEKPCVFVSHRLSDQATRWGWWIWISSLLCSAWRIFVLTYLVNNLRWEWITWTLCTSPIRLFPNWSDRGSSFRSSVFRSSTSLELKTWFPMD